MGSVHALRHYAGAFRLRSRQSAKPTTLAPPGVVPNYVDPNTISNQVVVTSLTLIVFTSFFVITRLLIKWRVVKHLGRDDGKQCRSTKRQSELMPRFSIDSSRFCENPALSASTQDSTRMDLISNSFWR